MTTQAHELITREQAYTQGRIKFFTGKPCKQGHVDQRYVSGGGCVACMNRYLPRRHPFRKDLSAYICPKLWVPSDSTQAEFGALETYLQQCIEAFYKHNRGQQ